MIFFYLHIICITYTVNNVKHLIFNKSNTSISLIGTNYALPAPINRWGWPVAPPSPTMPMSRAPPKGGDDLWLRLPPRCQWAGPRQKVGMTCGSVSHLDANEQSPATNPSPTLLQEVGDSLDCRGYQEAFLL